MSLTAFERIRDIRIDIRVETEDGDLELYLLLHEGESLDAFMRRVRAELIQIEEE